MPDDLTLPGDLPGLLRRSSPVLARMDNEVNRREFARKRGVVFVITTGDVGPVVAWHTSTEPVRCTDLRLDLTDPTGRVHAAWWAEQTFTQLLADTHRQSREAARVLAHARAGTDMPDADIATLRNLCLRLGGRAR